MNYNHKLRTFFIRLDKVRSFNRVWMSIEKHGSLEFSLSRKALYPVKSSSFVINRLFWKVFILIMYYLILKTVLR